MHSKDEIEISIVPKEFLPFVLRKLWYLFVRGCNISKQTTEETINELHNGNCLLWIVCCRGCICCLFVSRVCGGGSDDGGDGGFVGISHLAGSEPRKWAKAVSAKLIDYGQHVGAGSVRHFGSPAWAKLVPEYKKLSGAGRSALYERVV